MTTLVQWADTPQRPLTPPASQPGDVNTLPAADLAVVRNWARQRQAASWNALGKLHSDVAHPILGKECVLVVTVDKTGWVTDVKVTLAADVNLPIIAEKLVKEIKGWEIEGLKSGCPGTATFRFRFAPPKYPELPDPRLNIAPGPMQDQ